VEEQRHGELKVLATQLDAQYHLIDSTTEARLVADITLRHARLEAAAGKEAALQQVLHQLQPDVRKGSQAMHSKQEVLAAQQAQIAAVEQQVAQKRQANAHRSQQTEVADGRVEAMQRQVDARKEKGKELAAGLDQGTRQRTQLHEKQQELMQELGAGKDT
jgi:chromosome segregation ATPase